MNRKEMIDFVNSKICPQVNTLDFTFSPAEVVKTVERWRVQNHVKINAAMVPDVLDGFLFINDKPVGRIASRLPRVTVSDGAIFWEGRILSRQEAIYC